MEEKAGDGVEERGKGIDGMREKTTAENIGAECLNLDIEEGDDGDDHEHEYDHGRSRKMEKPEVEKVCRICHLSREPLSKKLLLISLGCDCKGELGSSHQHCAEAWFTQKGDRICEICGKDAKNVNNNTEETSIFMMEWDELRMMAASIDYSYESSRRCRRFFCNLFLACLLLVLVLLWLFREIDLI